MSEFLVSRHESLTATYGYDTIQICDENSMSLSLFPVQPNLYPNTHKHDVQSIQMSYDHSIIVALSGNEVTVWSWLNLDTPLAQITLNGVHVFALSPDASKIIFGFTYDECDGSPWQVWSLQQQQTESILKPTS
eukprot:PhF_6_TR12590/c0_g1_i1/m.19826